MANDSSNVKNGKNAKPTLGALDGVHPGIGMWVRRGLLVLIALLALLLVVRQVRASREAQVAKAYDALTNAVTFEDFDRIVTDYPGTAVAQQARLSAAQELFSKADYTGAAERFAAAATSGNDAIALRATLGQAQACEALGKTDPAQVAKALQLFADAGGKAATRGLTNSQIDALLGQVRCYRLNGDLAKAKELVEAAKKLLEASAKAGGQAADPALRALSQRVGWAADSLAAYELAEVAPPPAPAAEPAAEKDAAKPTADPAN